MALYLISYDLVAQPEPQYTALINQLQRWGARRVLKSEWLFISTSSALEIVTALIALVTPRDRLFVTEITKRSAWRGTLVADTELRGWFAHARD